jgi:serine/threonine-protein kinase
MDRCPTLDQLEQWLQQPVDSPEPHLLAAHVDECLSCQHALERLTAGAGRPGFGASPKPPAGVILPLAERLKEVPPVHGGPPPGGKAPGRPSPGAVAPPPQLEQEIRDLLRRRLRVATLVAAAVFATFGWLLLGDVPAAVFTRFSGLQGRLVIVAGFLVAASCAAVVWLRPSLSLASLRAVELLVFGVGVAYAANFRYTALMHGLDGPWEGPSHRGLFLTQIVQINNTLWNFVIVCYGVFIPNTWRRCVVVVAVMVVIPLAITLIVGVEHEVVRQRLPFLLSFTILGLLVSAALAVFGSFKISSLQREAFAARQVGQYRLKQRLGVGGMGEVYLAEHRLLKRPCAVKIIRSEHARDPNLLRRFEREVQATARLSHFNTVEIFDYGRTEDGRFYYVMEYLAGLSLEELVAREGPQPPARVIHFLRQLCGALREAHEAGLVHRDIKPSNVIVCRHGGQYDVVKLLDFGLVLTLDVGDAAGTKLTREGLILGTPEFMSPEQANGTATLDAWSDLYSLGAVAYFLLTGRSPFAGRPVLKTLIAHLHEPPAPLTDHRPDIPADLQAVVLRCLAKDPGQRFADAASLERDLEQCACVGRWTEAQARERWQGPTRGPMGAGDDPETGAEG